MIIATQSRRCVALRARHGGSALAKRHYVNGKDRNFKSWRRVNTTDGTADIGAADKAQLAGSNASHAVRWTIGHATSRPSPHSAERTSQRANKPRDEASVAYFAESTQQEARKAEESVVDKQAATSKLDGQINSTERATGTPNGGPSLYEQLFPDQAKAQKQPGQTNHIPPVPIKALNDLPKPNFISKAEAAQRHWDTPAHQRRYQFAQEPSETTLLVLRNASKNLVEEDFKRLIPQGKHLEGWTLSEGDIIRIIPGRNLENLAQNGTYFLLFSSAFSAYTYQTHAARIHRLAATHMPSSFLSPISLSPGVSIDGLNASAAIESFTLVPPSQALTLRLSKPPFSPLIDALVRAQGYPQLLDRAERMPYEARLTLEGPQLTASQLKYIFLHTGKERGLGWSGGTDLAPKLTKWIPPGQYTASEPVAEQTLPDGRPNRRQRRQEARVARESIDPKDRAKWREAPPVYVVGFETERAMQSFIFYWNRRPVEQAGFQRREDEDGDDLPPIAHVEVLW